MYETIISTSNEKYIIKNMHYISIGDFEERSELYSDFVVKLHNSLVEYDIVFSSGVSRISYYSQMILVILTLYFVIKVLFSFAIMTELIIVKLLFMGYLLYLGYGYFKKNYPKKYKPLNIPDKLLPKN